MGDFSIRCGISGVPIPCGAEVLVLTLGRNKKYSGPLKKCSAQDSEDEEMGRDYYWAVCMPTKGRMGSYGEVDDFPYDKRYKYMHVLPRLWKAAGEIWAKAMFGNKIPSLMDEILAERERHAKLLHDFAAIGYTPKYSVCSDNAPWLRRFIDLLLFAPEWGEGSELHNLVKGWVLSDEPPLIEQVQHLQDTVASSMSCCIVGKVIAGGGYDGPMEQYPTLKYDLQWHQAIVKEIRTLRKELRL